MSVRKSTPTGANDMKAPLFVLFFCTFTATANGQAKLLTGSIKSLDAKEGTVTVTPNSNDPNAPPINLKVNDSTRIIIDGKAGTFKLLAVEDKVAVSFDEQSRLVVKMQVTSNASVVAKEEQAKKEREAKERQREKEKAEFAEKLRLEDIERKKILDAKLKREADELEIQRLANEAKIKEQERLAAAQAAKQNAETEERQERNRIAAETARAQTEIAKKSALEQQRRNAEENERQRIRRQQEDEETARAIKHAAFVASVILAVIVGSIVLWVVLWFMSLIYIIKDTRNRSVEHGVFWLIGTLVFGVITLAVYLLSRPPGTLEPCEKCGQKKLPHVLRCPHCGRKTKMLTDEMS